MNQLDEFLNRANECQRMARSTKDRAARAAWTAMAERWMRCANVARRDAACTDYARRKLASRLRN